MLIHSSKTMKTLEVTESMLHFDAVQIKLKIATTIQQYLGEQQLIENIHSQHLKKEVES